MTNNEAILKEFKGFNFEVGKQYQNRKGNYTVLKVTSTELNIQYENGSKATLNKKIAEKMLFNIRCEQEKENRVEDVVKRLETKNKLSSVEENDLMIAYEKYFKEYPNRFKLPIGQYGNLDENLAWTLGALAANASLTCNVAEDNYYRFIYKYQKLSGQSDKDIKSHLYKNPIDPNKPRNKQTWGIGLDLTFHRRITETEKFKLPKELNVLKTNSKENTNSFVIHCNEFCFFLISEFGFKLGKQNIKEIRNRIPSELIEYFDEGTKV